MKGSHKMCEMISPQADSKRRTTGSGFVSSSRIPKYCPISLLLKSCATGSATASDLLSPPGPWISRKRIYDHI